MATVDSINSTSTIAPVVTSGTSNNTDNVRAFQRLRALADTQSINFQQAIFENDDIYNNFSSTELLSLNSQSLDILNGIAPSTEDALNSVVQGNLTQVAAQQAATLTADGAATNVLNLDSIQRENLSSIINEFSNAPFTQETFQNIQNALVAANINPQQISLQAILQEVFSGALPNSYYAGIPTTDDTFEAEAA